MAKNPSIHNLTDLASDQWNKDQGGTIRRCLPRPRTQILGGWLNRYSHSKVSQNIPLRGTGTRLDEFVRDKIIDASHFNGQSPEVLWEIRIETLLVLYSCKIHCQSLSRKMFKLLNKFTFSIKTRSRLECPCATYYMFLKDYDEQTVTITMLSYCIEREIVVTNSSGTSEWTVSKLFSQLR